MSCHDIGRGLNTVTKKVIELYDQEKIEFEDVKNLLFTIRKAVHHCDVTNMKLLLIFTVGGAGIV